MSQPRTEPVAGVVFHSAQFGRGAQRIGDPFRRALVIGGEGNTHMAVI